MIDAKDSFSAKQGLLVSFGGKMGSGKDTAADILEKIAAEHKVHFANKRFAGKLRECVGVLTGGRFTMANTQTTAEKSAKLPWNAFGDTLAEAQINMILALEVAVGSRVVGAEADVDPISKIRVRLAQTSLNLHSSDYQDIVLKALSIVAGHEYAFDTPVDFKMQITADMTVGKLLQLFGTDVGRNMLGEKTWINAFDRDWKHAGRTPTLIRDQRFPDELTYIQETSGLTFLVDADKRMSTSKTSTTTADGRSTAHASETSLGDIPRKEFTAVIPNNGTLDELEAFIRKEIWPLVEARLIGG